MIADLLGVIESGYERPPNPIAGRRKNAALATVTKISCSPGNAPRSSQKGNMANVLYRKFN
jgi:hypothetical protein